MISSKLEIQGVAEWNRQRDTIGETRRGEVDEISTSRYAAVLPVLALGEGFDLSSFVPTIPWWFTWVLLPFLMFASLWWAIRERSVSGTADRGKRNIQRTLWAFGVVSGGVFGGLLGGLEGLETLTMHFGYLAVDHWELLAKFGAVVGSWSVLDRVTDFSGFEILAVLVVLFLLILVLDDD